MRTRSWGKASIGPVRRSGTRPWYMLGHKKDSVHSGFILLRKILPFPSKWT